MLVVITVSRSHVEVIITLSRYHVLDKRTMISWKWENSLTNQAGDYEFEIIDLCFSKRNKLSLMQYNAN